MSKISTFLIFILSLVTYCAYGQKGVSICEKVRFQLKDRVWSSYFYIRETNFAEYKKVELSRGRFMIPMGKDSLLSAKDTQIRKNMQFKSEGDVLTWIYGDTLEVYNYPNRTSYIVTQSKERSKKIKQNITHYKCTHTKGKIKTVEYLDEKKRCKWSNTYVYDDQGNCIEEREYDRGKIKERSIYHYDIYNSVIRKFRIKYSSEDDEVISDLSDSLGVITRVLDQKNSPKYDSRQNLVYDSLYIIYYEPFGDTTWYFYQEVNNYEYDSLNRCTRSNFTHFEYDSLNRVTRKMIQKSGRLVCDEKYIYTSSGDTSFVSTVASSHLTLDNKVDVNTSNRYQLITYTKSYVYDEQGRKRAIIWRREGKLCWMDFFMYR